MSSPVNQQFSIAHISRERLEIRQRQSQTLVMNIESMSGLAKNTPDIQQVHFHRLEINLIMNLYGRMVALGEWRDYGISPLKDVAIFSIFRRAAETPLYRIEKRPALRLKQGQYALIAMGGQVLKRGSDLKNVLRVLERKLIRPVK